MTKSRVFSTWMVYLRWPICLGCILSRVKNQILGMHQGRSKYIHVHVHYSDLWNGYSTRVRKEMSLISLEDHWNMKWLKISREIFNDNINIYNNMWYIQYMSKEGWHSSRIYVRLLLVLKAWNPVRNIWLLNFEES